MSLSVVRSGIGDRPADDEGLAKGRLQVTSELGRMADMRLAPWPHWSAHSLGVDDVVAVEVALTDGGKRYFLTWGRIQDAVDPAPLCDLVLRFAGSCSLGGTPSTARLCRTLREAADSASAPYFYECFAAIASRSVPAGDAYNTWQRERATQMAAGREIWYCGGSA